jgi:hypothetical protein
MISWLKPPLELNRQSVLTMFLISSTMIIESFAGQSLDRGGRSWSVEGW